MKPVYLELAAFGPYLEPQIVAFDQLDAQTLFLIHGPTGAGKSSILDAICYALFDATSVGERQSKDLPTTMDPGAMTKVVFTFDHKGRRYRVTRIPTQQRAKKNGEGLTNVSGEAKLEDITGLLDLSLTGDVLGSKTSTVTTRIQTLLGCNVGQFRQTVVLPQGDFRKVITDHKERREILANIFETGRFANLAECLKAKATELGRVTSDIEAKRKERLEEAGVANDQELKESIEAAKLQLERAKHDEENAKKAYRQAMQAHAVAQTLSASFERLEQVRSDLAQLEQREADMRVQRQRLEQAQRAESLWDAYQNLNVQEASREKLSQQVEDLEDERAKAEQTLEKATERLEEEQAREEERQVARTTFQRLDALKEQVEGLRAARGREEELEDAAQKEKENFEALEGSLNESQSQRDDLQKEWQSDSERLQSKGDLQLHEQQLKTELETLQLISEFQQGEATVHKELKRHSADSETFEDIYRTIHNHSADVLADSLQAGDPCPVCGSDHHPRPAESDQGTEALHAALADFGSAQAHVASLKTQLATYQKQRKEAVEKAGWLEEALPTHEEADRELIEMGDQLQSLKDLETRQGEIRGTLTQIDANLPQQWRQRDDAKRRLTEARSTLQTVKVRIETVLEQLQPEHHDPEAFFNALAEAEERHSILEAALQAAQDQAKQAQATLNMTQSNLRLLSGQLTTAEEAREREQENFAERLQQNGFVNSDAFLEARIEPDNLEALQKVVTDYDKKLSEAHTACRVLGEQLDGKERPDLEATEFKQGEAQEAHETATDTHREVKGKLARLEDTGSELAKLEEELGATIDKARKARKLSDLANGRLSGYPKVTFETFVLQSIFDRVLAVGNKHLTRMTSGRYALHLRHDEESLRAGGLELHVTDHHSSGESRAVHTLSGGEGFLASLALALGLSEIAQQQSGGTELGALFIDEGFGSLDSTALEGVVRILRTLPQGNRMVGVITHVNELKRRIPTQLLIEQGVKGSTIKLRLNA